MGVYNCGGTLAQALDSLLAQTYQDFEVIMCDDGSTDNTAEVAAGYVSRFPHKFRLIHNERNMGLNRTLNNCLERVRGAYIARMDGDDISLPDRFAKEVDFLDCNPEYAIVSGPMVYFDERGEFRRGRGNGEVSARDFLAGSPFCHAPCMVRREAYMTVNGYTVAKKLLRVEDYHLWFKMYACGYKGYNLVDVIYAMRDDRYAVRRRRFKDRLNEARLKLWGFRRLGIQPWLWVYALRPILVGMLPGVVYNYLHRKG